jgi:hypothetical protein
MYATYVCNLCMQLTLSCGVLDSSSFLTRWHAHVQCLEARSEACLVDKL